jgi:hypothetical protein
MTPWYHHGKHNGAGARRPVEVHPSLVLSYRLAHAFSLVESRAGYGWLRVTGPLVERPEGT